jgi:hypothetical protein
MKTSKDPNDLAELAKETEEERAVERRPFEERDRFQPDQNVVYAGIAIIRVGDPVPSTRGYGPSTPVDVVDLGDGNRLTWWVQNQYEQEHLRSAVDRATAKDKGFPMEVIFSRVQRTSASTGNTYNAMDIRVIRCGNDIEGNLGLDTSDNPSNDGSVFRNDQTNSANSVSVKNPNDPASDAQWGTIRKNLDKVLGAWDRDDVIASLLKADIEVSDDELAGDKGRFGSGSLKKGKASTIISHLMAASSSE